MLSSLNLFQIPAPGYTLSNVTEIGDCKSRHLGRWKIYTVKMVHIVRIILSAPVLFFSHSCYSGQAPPSCPPGRIMLFLRKAQGLWQAGFKDGCLTLHCPWVTPSLGKTGPTEVLSLRVVSFVMGRKPNGWLLLVNKCLSFSGLHFLISNRPH